MNRPDKPEVSTHIPATPRIGGPFGRTLMQAIDRMDSGPRLRESLALAYWPRVAGTQAAAATEPDSVRDGVLVIRTKSSAWSQELTLHKTRLLDGLNRLLGDRVITDIRFRAQGFTLKEPVVEETMPTPEEMAAILLEPAEKAELRGRLLDLHKIEDDTLRQKLAVRLTAEAKLRHWRLENGWHVCWRCSALHKSDFSVCPICRLSP